MAMTAAVTMAAAVMGTVAAAAVSAAVMTAVSAAILRRCRRSNPLTTALPVDWATGAAAASVTTAPLQRCRHQRHADLPASAHVWLFAGTALLLLGRNISLSLSLGSLGPCYDRSTTST